MKIIKKEKEQELKDLITNKEKELKTAQESLVTLQEDHQKKSTVNERRSKKNPQKIVLEMH